MPEKKNTSKPKNKGKIPEDLKSMDINVNSFGEIEKNIDVDSINAFLNRKVSDKKLKKETD